MLSPLICILVLVVSTIVGYLLIRNVPSLLHTPLMSGMNALSGITVVGAVSATGTALIAFSGGHLFISQLIGGLAIVLATINVVGGFSVTHRMLRMFDRKKKTT